MGALATGDMAGGEGRPAAMVLLERAVPLDPWALVRTVRTLYPAAAGAVDDPEDAQAPFLRIDGTRLCVAVLDAAVPWLIPPDEEAMFPSDVMGAVRRHRAHVLITCADARDDILWEHRLVTAAVGAVLALCRDALLVDFAARALRLPFEWRWEAGRAFSKERLPLFLWMDVVPFRKDGLSGWITLGMVQFAGREVLVQSARLDSADLLDWIEDLGSYVARRSVPGNTVPRDGDTFGRTAEERIGVRWDDSEATGGSVIRAIIP